MRNLVSSLAVSTLLVSAGPALACPWAALSEQGHDLPLADGQACRPSPEEVCRWSFAYRSAAAEDMFDRLAAHLSTCLGPPGGEAAPVNHPDSYRLLQFEAKEAVISLSLKDKAALQRSFVFLRVDPVGD